MNKIDLEKIIISPRLAIQKAIKQINTNGLRGVFVCDEDNELIGIVMDADIRQAILSNIDLNAAVNTIMKTSPFKIDSKLPSKQQKLLLSKSHKILAPLVDEAGHVVDYLYMPDFLSEAKWMQNNVNSRVLPPQKILVIGGAGYIGSVLSDKLLRIGYKVRILDLLLYGKESLAPLKRYKEFDFIRGDCRDEHTVTKALIGIDAVVHLGEIVGDPACSINESFTIETNYTATHMIVEACVRQGIKRFIFASSCSVYGNNNHEVDESSELNPVSLYARCKIESEECIRSFSNNHFCPTILRLATVHGKSFRQRFDLVVNLLSIKAIVENRIQIFGGEQWRPFIAVSDVCQGIVAILRSEGIKVNNQIFNLGDDRENYQIKQIGQIVNELISDLELDYREDKIDTRNYRVSFVKIKNDIGFTTEYSVTDTVRDFISSSRNDCIFHDYKNNKYYNALTLKDTG